MMVRSALPIVGGMTIPFAVPECRVAHLVERHDDSLVVPVRLDAASGRCPECGQASRSVHGRYHRHPADLPLSASRTTLRIEVRRFYCRNPTCRRRTFAETPLTLLTLRARRTRRLCEAQARVGRACGGAGGARLLAHLHMPASRATVLRLVTHLPMPDAPTHIRVGIDDWAIRKGSRYGTIVVDLDRRRVVDLLPDRTAPTVAGWLERHSGVALVARDRSIEYARGASLGAPQARQVADRWHLLTNMRQAVERWLAQPTSVLDESEAAVVSRVEQDDTAQAVAGLARRFTALVRAAGKGKPLADDQDAAADIVAWITKARTCEASAIATFASGLEADIAAVRPALTEPWSSGQAEGQVNRLTLIKRQCYGRAGLDLLKRRMVLAA